MVRYVPAYASYTELSVNITGTVGGRGSYSLSKEITWSKFLISNKTGTEENIPSMGIVQMKVMTDSRMTAVLFPFYLVMSWQRIWSNFLNARQLQRKGSEFCGCFVSNRN